MGQRQGAETGDKDRGQRQGAELGPGVRVLEASDLALILTCGLSLDSVKYTIY